MLRLVVPHVVVATASLAVRRVSVLVSLAWLAWLVWLVSPVPLGPVCGG